MFCIVLAPLRGLDLFRSDEMAALAMLIGTKIAGVTKALGRRTNGAAQDRRRELLYQSGNSR